MLSRTYNIGLLVLQSHNLITSFILWIRVWVSTGFTITWWSVGKHFTNSSRFDIADKKHTLILLSRLILCRDQDQLFWAFLYQAGPKSEPAVKFLNAKMGSVKACILKPLLSKTIFSDNIKCRVHHLRLGLDIVFLSLCYLHAMNLAPLVRIISAFGSPLLSQLAMAPIFPIVPACLLACS